MHPGKQRTGGCSGWCLDQAEFSSRWPLRIAQQAGVQARVQAPQQRNMRNERLDTGKGPENALEKGQGILMHFQLEFSKQA